MAQVEAGNLHFCVIWNGTIPLRSEWECNRQKGKVVKSENKNRAGLWEVRVTCELSSTLSCQDYELIQRNTEV